MLLRRRERMQTQFGARFPALHTQEQQWTIRHERSPRRQAADPISIVQWRTTLYVYSNSADGRNLVEQMINNR